MSRMLFAAAALLGAAAVAGGAAASAQAEREAKAQRVDSMLSSVLADGAARRPRMVYFYDGDPPRHYVGPDYYTWRGDCRTEWRWSRPLSRYVRNRACF